MTVRKGWSDPVAPALDGGRDATRKVHLGDTGTALAPPLTRRRRRAVGGCDVLRDRGARVPVGRRGGVLVVRPPSGIAHIPLTMRDTLHGDIDGRGIVPGAAVQTGHLLMGIIANDAHITTTVRADIGTDDTDHARSRALLTRHLAPKRCQRPGIDRLARELPVSLSQRIALAISLDANMNYAANSRGS
jgi:hypothetical protein